MYIHDYKQTSCLINAGSLGVSFEIMHIAACGPIAIILCDCEASASSLWNEVTFMTPP
jgi:hypothetical protein